MLEWLGLPVAAAADAARIDRILVLVHWLMLVLFAGWGLFFVYVLVRFRRRANPVAVVACAARHDRARGPSASRPGPGRERSSRNQWMPQTGVRRRQRCPQGRALISVVCVVGS